MKRVVIVLFAAMLLLSGLAFAANDKKAAPAKKGAPIVVLETTQGKIELRLMPAVAPKACENFTRLVEKGYYNGLTFHRIIKGFMIQGGDPLGNGMGGQSIWGKPFVNECTPKVTFNREGILAMANAGPDTNGSQFFITVAPQPSLNGGYTIFGEVIAGMDVVHKLEVVATGLNDKPVQPQKIIKAVVKK